MYCVVSDGEDWWLFKAVVDVKTQEFKDFLCVDCFYNFVWMPLILFPLYEINHCYNY